MLWKKNESTDAREYVAPLEIGAEQGVTFLEKFKTRSSETHFLSNNSRPSTSQATLLALRGDGDDAQQQVRQAAFDVEARTTV